MASLMKKIEQVPTGSLKQYPNNPRRGNIAVIAESLRRNEQFSPIVVQASTQYVLSGNHTLMAARQLGWAEIDAVIIDVDDDQARRIMLAANRTADVAEYDLDALAELLSYLDDDYEGTGYTTEDVEALITPPEQLPDMTGHPDDAPEASLKPRSVLGDLWKLGPHFLLCGDSTNPDDVDRVLADIGEPSIIYTDPPYGISIVKSTGNVGGYAPDKDHPPRSSRGKVGGGGAFGGKKNEKAGGTNVIASSNYLPVAGDDTTDAAADAFRLLHVAYPTAKHVWWGGNHYAASAGLPDSSCWLVWDKENTGNFADAELAWTNHPGAVRVLRHMWNGMLRASERGKRVHPTQKPVALAEWAFGEVDKENARRTVLDVFGGSGSTLIAAHTTGRTAAVIEMEPAYVDVICRRYQQASGTFPIHAESGATVDFTVDPANQ